ncbi:MAG: CBS domain-containing protein [Betaproteobacteria bacterium]|nr:CBS domain-containing protein [Betaproteobacteria bacterium]PWB65456.1 MAG: oxidoreductase [Betaproteobacteria bacterium]
MKQVVILGAGTGGALVANLLTQKLDLKEWVITIVDRSDQHVYQPGLLFLPFGLYGHTDHKDLVKPIGEPLPRNVNFLAADVMRIDPEKKIVETSVTTLRYDFLVSALGCRVAPEEIEGLAEPMGKDGVHTFYTLEGAVAMRSALERMTSGRLVIDVCDMPIKCPVAPIEFAFLADYYFTQKGVRDAIDITLVTPYSGAFTKPNANRVLTAMAQEKGVNVVADFAAESVDAAAKTLRSFDGRTLEYDLLCAIPPNVGPQVIDDSELGDGTGYALTDPRTLKSRKADFVYFLGDNTNVSTSKAGSVAHFEAETVVENLLREIEGKPAMPTFDGHANCFIETGHHKAMLLDFNYDIEPLEGSFPMAHVGPFSLLKESYMNHVGKLAFQWVYWNLLLKGRLPNVPLLPSHMNFVGKDLETTPHARHAREMKVRDVMTKEVVSVHAGSALTAAATLMVQKKVSGVPVLNVNDKLIGVLTEADFLSAMNLEQSAVTDTLETVVRKRRARKGMGTIVDDIMTKSPITIREDETLRTAVTLMDTNRIKRLIVTDDEAKVRGVVSRGDLIKLYAMK